MMKKLFPFLLAVFMAVSLCSPSRSAQTDDAALMRERSVVLWLGGRKLGDDMVIGAEGQLIFQLIDRTLASRIYSEPDNFPEQIVWNAQYIDKAARQKSDVVILFYRAVNRWTFDPKLLKHNGEPIDRSQYLSSVLSAQTGSLPKGTEDVLAFSVPRSHTKPGKTLTFSYGNESVALTIPRR